jgi:uncharacterized membrane protein YbhN (UPF0104 family)
MGRRTGRIVGATALLAVLVWRLGAGPFLDGIRLVNPAAVAAAIVIGAVTTVCCAWRWRAVSRGLGVDVSLPRAIAAYYRSLFLNTTLPTGIAGDVHRAVRHGRDAGDARGTRSVAWERTAGQVVQLALTLIVLMVLPSPVRPWMPAVAAAVAACVVVVAVFQRTRPPSTATRLGRIIETARADVRQGLLARRTWPVIVAASVAIIIGNVAMFVIAARTAGTEAPITTLSTVALIVLAAMSIPLSIAGWGVREGAAAWVFGAVGLGAAAGITTAVVYGVMVLTAALPGAAVLLAGRMRTVPSKEVIHG